MIWHETTSPLLTIFAWVLSTVARISLFAQSKDSHLSSRRTASYFLPCPLGSRTQIQHFYGKLQSFWLMKSKDVQNNPADPQLWRTGGVLQCCHCSAERKERVRRTPGEKSRFSVQKGPEKQRFFTGSGKVVESLFHLQPTTILAWFLPSWCIQL